MKQKGNNSNNVQVGTVEKSSTVNVVQNFSTPNHTQLEVEEDSVFEFSKADLSKERTQGFMKFLGGTMLGCVGFLSDAIGVSSQFGISMWWLFPIGAFAGLLFAAPHVRAAYILRNVPRTKNEAAFVGNNEIVEEGKNGKIVSYRRSAECIYPNCPGKIVLSDVPVREKARLGKNFVGVCSLAGRDHSYRIDYVWNAYPESFDWRPIEPSTERP